MIKPHHVIYVPGLLDDIYHIQGLLIKSWFLYGLCVHLHVMPWAGPQPYEPKFKSLLEQIDKFTGKGHKVSLVGASAGASAVINAFIERRDSIHKVALICPKINGPETVSDKTYAENPAFKTSLYALQANLKQLSGGAKAKFHMYYSPTDNVIPYAGMTIPGVGETKLPSLRHGQSIIYAISLGGHAIAKFLKH